MGDVTEEEEEAFLTEGDYWHPDLYTPDNEMFLDLDDGEAEAEQFNRYFDYRGDESSEAADSKEQSLDHEDEEGTGFGAAVTGKLEVRDDDDGLRDAVEVDVPDHATASPSELCRLVT